MRKINFDIWLGGFRKSIANYGYYVDFAKVYRNAEKLRGEFCLLDSLIGSQNIEFEFDKLVNKYHDIIKCIPILLAVRESEIYVLDGRREFNFNFINFKNLNYSLNDYKTFMRKTGLFDLWENHIIRSTYDYVVGVEVGLDSNARKNRCGTIMENIVEGYIKDAGYVLDDINNPNRILANSYFKQVSKKKMTSICPNFVNPPTGTKKKAEKRFDFVLKKNQTVYAIETNFYSSGGSKLNETARSYKQLSIDFSSINNFEFVWITDGEGWNKAKNNLRETFLVMDHIYSVQDLENGALHQL